MRERLLNTTEAGERLERLAQFSPRVKLMDIDDVLLATKANRSTLYKAIAAGRFPKACIKIGKKRMWQESTLADFLDRKAGKR